jgi:hypothetical protein
MAKKRKRKPDPAWEAFEARSDQTIKRVRELVADAEAQAARRQAETSEKA